MNIERFGVVRRRSEMVLHAQTIATAALPPH